MEMTKSNFYELLPQVLDAIEKADFIAIDCELTGLNTGSDINAFDTQRQYYDKVHRSSKNFLVIQYGLCIFKYDKEAQVFKQQGYNFYIFPRPVNKHVPDHRFLCQASSIDFLVAQGFDFNKLFREGIPYLNTVEEDKYKESLLDSQKLRANQLQNAFSPQNNKPNNISMTAEEKTFVDDVLKQIEEFILSDKEEMNLPRCNAYMRRLVYQEAQKTIENKASLETRLLDNKDRILVVTRFKSKMSQQEKELKKIEEEEQEFKNCIGFSEVVKIIVSSGKLIIGHNICLDLLHTIEKFLTPLPNDYQEFKDLVNCMFPKLLDTKYMSSAAPFKELIKSSVLSHLLETVGEKPFAIPTVEIEENRQGYELKNRKEHEAGYDAYITGLCFLAMWQYLGNLDNSDKVDPFTDLSLLEPYTNRIFLMRLYDAPYMRIGGNDPATASREHVLYLTFPKEWKLNDIVQLFSPFGNVYVAWIDDRSAYVGLQRRDQTALALSTLSQSDTYTVTTYAKRQAQISGLSTLPCSPFPLTRRKRSIDSVGSATKKKRTSSFGESSASKKCTFNAIEEDPGELLQSPHVSRQHSSKSESETLVWKSQVSKRLKVSKKGNVKKIAQTFEESSDWD